MGWKNGAILRKKVRQPKPELLPYPDSEGVWECNDFVRLKRTFFLACKHHGKIMLRSYKDGKIYCRKDLETHLRFKKLKK